MADDGLVSRRIMSATLCGAGHEVIEAKDGDEAWGILQQDNAPRLAVLDWEMPGLCGPAAASFVGKNTRLAHTPSW